MKQVHRPGRWRSSRGLPSAGGAAGLTGLLRILTSQARITHSSPPLLGLIPTPQPLLSKAGPPPSTVSTSRMLREGNELTNDPKPTTWLRCYIRSAERHPQTTSPPKHYLSESQSLKAALQELNGLTFHILTSRISEESPSPTALE